MVKTNTKQGRELQSIHTITLITFVVIALVTIAREISHWPRRRQNCWLNKTWYYDFALLTGCCRLKDFRFNLEVENNSDYYSIEKKIF